MENKTLIFENKINLINNNEYKVLEPYVNNNTKILVKHLVCRHEWKVLPMQMTRSKNPTRCPHCYGTPKKDTETFKREVQTSGSQYEFTGIYVSNLVKSEFKHLTCGRTFLMRPNDFQQGYRCPHCYGTPKKTLDQFKTDVFKLHGTEYSVISTTYDSTNTKIYIKHNSCHHEFSVTPNNFLNQRTTCPLCSTLRKESVHVKLIDEYLIYHNITYVREYIDPLCKNKRALPFDFYLPDKNILIEFDGMQHFRDTGRFKCSHINDEIKNNFVRSSKKYSLLRIPYFLFNKKEEQNRIKMFSILDLFFKEPSETIEKYNITYIE